MSCGAFSSSILPPDSTSCKPVVTLLPTVHGAETSEATVADAKLAVREQGIVAFHKLETQDYGRFPEGCHDALGGQFQS
jgi:hypothetical protein